MIPIQILYIAFLFAKITEKIADFPSSEDKIVCYFDLFAIYNDIVVDFS